MKHAGVRGRAAATAVLITAMVALSALATPGAAQATDPEKGGVPERVAVPSASDLEPEKSARAECPGGTLAYAAGGEIVGGGGAVIMTGVVPSADLLSVTVTAVRVGATPWPWSVVAHAVCDKSLATPVRVTEQGEGAAVATCRNGKRVFGTGYRIEPVSGASARSAYVTGVMPNQDYTAVGVRAGGALAGSARVAAIAICYPPTGGMVPTTAKSDLGPTWPKVAVASTSGSTFEGNSSDPALA